MPLHIALVDPEIPQNCGNVARTCAAIGAPLHVVGTPGFSFEDRYLRRAGLDYWPLVELVRHETIEAFLSTVGIGNCVFTSAHARTLYTEFNFPDRCYLVFGRESTGLPKDFLGKNLDRSVRIPTRAGVRSLNLSNAVAVLAYEFLRRREFADIRGESAS